VPPSRSSVQQRPQRQRQASTSSSIASSVKKKVGPVVAPRRAAKKLVYVIANYSYEGQSDLELTINEGDRILMTGEDQGDGWMEGELDGVRGSFPSNYVTVE